MTTLNWIRRSALGVLLPLAMFGQADPKFPVTEGAAPPEVSTALRERVTQFFQYHIGTVNRKAFDMVAEDTKDFYYASGKMQFLEVVIADLHFSEDLQKASVRLDTTRNWQVGEHTTVATTPVVTTWKIEDGKWVFYLDSQIMDQSATPMGNSRAPQSGALTAQPLTNPDGTINIPKDFAEPARVSAQAQALISQTGLDKETLTLNLGKVNEDQVVFHNGFTGPVSLQVGGDPRVPGLKITLDKRDLGASENAVLRVSYDPPADSTPSASDSQFTLRLNLIPWNQEYPIRLTLVGARGQ